MVPGIMNWLSTTLSALFLAPIIIVPGIVVKKDEKGFKFKLDRYDWMGIIILLLVVYAIYNKVDPIALIKAVGDILDPLKG